MVNSKSAIVALPLRCIQPGASSFILRLCTTESAIRNCLEQLADQASEYLWLVVAVLEEAGENLVGKEIYALSVECDDWQTAPALGYMPSALWA